VNQVYLDTARLLVHTYIKPAYPCSRV